MKRPKERGTPIDVARFRYWMSDFSGYRNPVTQGMIELWLEQFSSTDRDLAARILDAILFIGNLKIHTSFRELLNSLEGWGKSTSKRRGRWFFVPFSGSGGESGDSMVYAFRMANSMTQKKYSDLFIHRSELVAKNPGPEDTVVLIDDFTGTGTQACESWPIFQELLTGGPRIVLMLVAATEDALSRITKETDMEPFCSTTLRRRDGIFDAGCTHFTPEEKNIILRYCTTADPSNSKGFGELGLLIVLAHRTPNNTIPILWVTKRAWQGLFPRHD